VVAVLDSAPFSAQCRALPALLGQPATLAKGMYYRAWLTAHGIAVHQGATLKHIDGEQRVTAIRWGEHTVACDAVAFAHALRSETQLADLLGCEFSWNSLNRAWLPQRDVAGRSSIAGVYLAGDGAGIMGADAAHMAGERAALAVLADSRIAIDQRRAAELERQLASIERFRHGLETAFPFPLQWAAQAPDALIVCRCEEVSAGDVRAVVDEGHWEINRVKAHCRVGMGRCQGRMCGLAAAEIIAERSGRGIEATGRLRGQAPIKPLPFGVEVQP
jgi:NADPH-dependent 2,4-dienoyl-CoA reductase/sulfur reductase-like enzyme